MQTPVRAVWLVLAGILSVQVGAAFAKLVFDEVSPTGLVWVRVLVSALVLVALARPRWAELWLGHSRSDWLVVLGFGVSLAVMNWAIYQSFARMPLGLAVTIEFLGALGVALAGSRRLLDLVWVLLAAVGIGLLGIDGSGATPAGVLYALLAAAGWAAYILFSGATGRRWSGLKGLSLASVVAAVLLAPFAVATDGTALLDSKVLLVGALVGLMSSAVPYSFELVALRTMPPRVFGILMSLEPAAAALAGVVLLGELLGGVEWLAIACVVTASIGVTRSAGSARLGT